MPSFNTNKTPFLIKEKILKAKNLNSLNNIYKTHSPAIRHKIEILNAQMEKYAKLLTEARNECKKLEEEIDEINKVFEQKIKKLKDENQNQNFNINIQ